MKIIMLKVVFGCCLITLMATMSGCTTYTSGAVPDRFKSQIVKGKTTRVEVLQELGNPDQKIDLGDGKQQFSYIKHKYSMNPLSAVTGKGKSENTEFWLTFDANGTVTDFGEKPTLKRKNYLGGPQ